MTEVTLEHVNVTVPDPKATAATLTTLFDWRIRWEGASKEGGFSIHVGGKTSYLALYAPPKAPAGQITSEDETSYRTTGGLNHIAVTVPDLATMEAKVKAAGFEPRYPEAYEPGRRFYFYDHDGIEFEIVCYD